MVGNLGREMKLSILRVRMCVRERDIDKLRREMQVLFLNRKTNLTLAGSGMVGWWVVGD